MEETKHIQITPGTCGGRPRIEGTRIRVQNIVLWTEQGMSADEILMHYPQLSLANIYAALTYYFDNKVEMDQQFDADQAFLEACMKESAQAA